MTAAAKLEYGLPLRDFAASLTANFSLKISANPEDQLKGPVAALLSKSGALINRLTQTRTEAQVADLNARPDIAVAVGGLLTGYVELKAPGKGASPEHFTSRQDREQWVKFKQIPNLLYTDSVEWALYRTGNLVGSLVRLSGDPTRQGSKAVTSQDQVALNGMLADFLSWEPLVPSSPKRLAEILAPLCRILRSDALVSVQRKTSNLHQLAGEWRNALFSEADDAQFADAYAQTVTYALLLARLSGASEITPLHAAETLDKAHGLLAQALRVLADKQVRNEISVGIELLERTIAAINPKALKQKSPDLWLYFYEDFLAAYDPKLRRDRGAYYTPAEVIRSQCQLVSELLKTKMGKPLSFADEGVVVLDPAAGTGAYPLAAIQHGLGIVREKYGDGVVPEYATSLAQHTHAFEILVGPYAVAHLRVSQQVMDAEGELPPDGTHVYLTDTLESPHAEPKVTIPLFQRPLAEEHRRAREVKEKTTVLVCIGNPPYDRQEITREEVGLVERKGGWVRRGDDGQGGILEDFLAPARNIDAGVHLKNLYNDYVYFWRWAIWKVLEQNKGPGIISFITASSFLRGPGFVGMRATMRKLFDELWFLDLEGSNKGARKSENVFAIETPVVITVGIRFGVLNASEPAIAHYTRLQGTREEKLEILNSISSFEALKWRNCAGGWNDVFLPKSLAEYSLWPKLTNLLPWQHSGAQYKRTWPIAETRELLERRWESLTCASTLKKRKLFNETRDRQIVRSYKDLFSDLRLVPLADLTEETLSDPSSRDSKPRIQRYGFRSFDRQWAIADSRLGDFLRPSLWLSGGPHQLFLTSLLTDVLGRGPAAVVTDAVPDMHHFCNRGGKDVIPLWRDSSGTKPNITGGLISVLTRAFKKAVTPEDVFAYCYAILSAPAYVDSFYEELETPGPRVPFTRDATLFNQSVELGTQMIQLHTFGTRFVPAGKEPGVIPEGKARSVRSIGKEYPEDFTYDADTMTLRVGAGLFRPVIPSVWNFAVSDMKVVESWLGYRMRKPTGKRTSPLDKLRPTKWTSQMTRELLEVLWVLEHTVDLQPKLNANLASVLNGVLFVENDFPRPSAEEKQEPVLDESASSRQAALFESRTG